MLKIYPLNEKIYRRAYGVYINRVNSLGYQAAKSVEYGSCSRSPCSAGLLPVCVRRKFIKYNQPVCLSNKVSRVGLLQPYEFWVGFCSAPLFLSISVLRYIKVHVNLCYQPCGIGQNNNSSCTLMASRGKKDFVPQGTHILIREVVDHSPLSTDVSDYLCTYISFS